MTPLFARVAIVGVGLIGSSLLRVLRREGMARTLVAADASEAVRRRTEELGLADVVLESAGEAADGADLVILCTPVGTFAALGAEVGQRLAPGAILSDVGSVKGAAMRALAPHVPAHAHLIPAHPVAGTENSGPDAGFAALFEGRWCIITPPADADPAAVERVAELWRRVGSNVETMDAGHHDKVLAITSHLPHLIAYTIVGTATDLEETTQSEVIKFSAGGFRDFTRIAASDPIMWRDIFLANREAVLEMAQRLTEDLTMLQRAIRWGEGETLEALFRRTRDVRRGVIDAKQA
jgi:cyclohexadieny/prephenate dehydrogenase